MACAKTSREAALCSKAIESALSFFNVNECRLNALDISLDIINENDFFADVHLSPPALKIMISAGLVKAASSFWRGLDNFPPSNWGTEPSSPMELVQSSLNWLMLHELCHFELGHFRFLESFGIARRSSDLSNALETLPSRPMASVPLCLEMQADHEATEMFLGAYSPDEWQVLREKVSAISSMMILIELADTKNGAEGRTHPKASTRVFQLLGHLTEMPLVLAHVHQDTSLIPTENDLQAFAHNVTIPCFFDAIKLANVAEATSIVNDLDDLEAFFGDLEIAKLGDPSRYAELTTQGAQEWAMLVATNEKLLALPPSQKTT